MSTIKDVAKYAGVSVATASWLLHCMFIKKFNNPAK
ncbi:LacI family DNA-binding transcriptional regulator [Clostridium beijerinckii]|nr:LacI family DNA-binding transcriptional regulator [Clostridium beijerinckii]